MTDPEPTDLERALAAVDADSAGHWPTVAGILADAYRSTEKNRNQTFSLWIEERKQCTAAIQRGISLEMEVTKLRDLLKRAHDAMEREECFGDLFLDPIRKALQP